jgi:hypothetical protein
MRRALWLCGPKSAKSAPTVFDEHGKWLGWYEWDDYRPYPHTCDPWHLAI